MKTLHIAGVAVFGIILFAMGPPVWALENPDKMPWRTDAVEAFKEAREKGTPLIVEFSCDWDTG
ncbi:MAG: hypothetical protein E3J72_14665 [Planctomycetota bacterium]|nr:MAG: hypothetical protein E3J72_14665 [Planctomycetota bacterium]